MWSPLNSTQAQILRRVVVWFFVPIAIIAASPAWAQFENIEARAYEVFSHAYAQDCTSLETGADTKPTRPEIFDLTFKYEYEGDDREPHPYRLYQYHCFNGAYNQVHVFYGANEYGEVRQIQFATPELDIAYENDDSESSNYEIEIVGFTAQDQLVNSYFDPQTSAIYSHSKWRGLGDASSSGTWIFRRGHFVLTSFDVDASFDGEMDIQRVYGQGSPVQYD